MTLMKSRGVDIDYKTGEKARQDLHREYKEQRELLQRLGISKK